MGFFGWIFKMIISITLDALDFFMPPVLGTVYDIFLGFIGKLLWGDIGLLQFWEVFDLTDRFDAFIPTLTIAGILSIKELFED